MVEQKWSEAQKWEAAWWKSDGQGCVNSYHEEMKQLIYAERMGIVIDQWKTIDLKGKSVLDIGGGPASLLLKCYNGKKKVIDPLDMPAWVLERYKMAGVEVEKKPAEDMDESGWDEVWIYNCLQHVKDPALIIQKAKRAGKLIRIFEFLEREANIGHPHVLTETLLNDALRRQGTVGEIGGDIVGKVYYGAFETTPGPVELNWVNTGTEFPYPYYLAVKSALKTQKAAHFNMWLVKEPHGKYWDAVKDLITIHKVEGPVPDFPALKSLKDTNEFHHPENYIPAHLVDYYRWKILLENGGVFCDLDSFCLSDFCTMIGERLADKDFLAALVSDPHIHHNAIFAGVKGSPLVKRMYDECIIRLNRTPENFAWGNSGPDVLNDLVNANLDRVAEVEYGMLGGCIEMYQLFKPDGKLPDNIRFVHLWANSINGYWNQITEDYIEQSGDLFPKMVRGVLSPEEIRPVNIQSLGDFIVSRGSHYKPLFSYLKSNECHEIMEIGTYDGENALQMIRAAETKSSHINYYGFDLFEDITPEIIAEEFSHPATPPMSKVKRMLDENTTATITLIKGNTRETLSEFCGKLDRPVMDFIFIDGGHSLETVRNDWGFVSLLMHKDTMVFFDDYMPDFPALGCKTLVDSIDRTLYDVEVLPDFDDYPKTWGHLRCQLAAVRLKSVNVNRFSIVYPAKPALHVLGLAHTKTTKEYSACAYTQKVFKMCAMMKKLGYTVYHYGAEGSNPDCTEHIDVVSNAVQRQTYGDYDWKKEMFKHNPADLAYRTFDENAIREINARKGPRDLLLVSMGNYQKPIADRVSMMSVEMGIGYTGVFLDKRVFESYAWMNYIYGILDPQGGGASINHYDCVIPNYYDPSDFAFTDKKDDFYLYMGRLIPRKGVHIAAQCCERLGKKLVISGQGTEETIKSLGIDPKKVEFVGYSDVKQRSDLMSHARAVFVPTTYLEPFGGVNVEAMFCGTSAITTNFGGFTETVQNGKTGYRCHTMAEFEWAAKNVDKLDPYYIHDYAVNNFSMDRVSLMYEHYFMMLMDLWNKGWYESHPEPEYNLDWLKRY